MHRHIKKSCWLGHNWAISCGINTCSVAPAKVVQPSWRKDQQVPGGASVVIGGGGVIGCSVAYHLAKEGWKDIVLIEQGSLGCGTSWHSAGLVGRLKTNVALSNMSKYSADLYQQLQNEGYNTGWKQCGSLYLARTKNRIMSYRRALLNAERIGVHGEFLTPEQCQEKAPLLSVDELEGGFWVPEDGVVSVTDLTHALHERAKEMGVQFFEQTKVDRVVTRNDRVQGVATNKGYIDCRYFVNCTGQWARDVGQKSNQAVRVPLHSCEHFYLVTKPFEIPANLPMIRDYDGYIYLREWNGGLLGGGFEPKGKPTFHDGIPDDFQFKLLNEDWDQFQVILEQLLVRVPSLQTAQVQQLVNGPESFTPDGKPILGETPEVDNYFVAAGMNAMGVALAGGVGKYIAEWIIHGEPSINMWANDIRRFVDMHNNKKFLRARVSETLGLAETVPYWNSQMTAFQTGRRLRVSPLFTRMEKTAVFGQNMGYERPLYFSRGDEDEAVAYRPAVYRDSKLYEFHETEVSDAGTFGKPSWHDNVKSEYWACREGVCLIDMSTFTKYELRSAGREVVDFLQYMCSNDVDRAVGMVIHTGMQNHNGGYENDCSLVRLEHNHYFMIGPTAQQTRAASWLKHHLPLDGSVQMSDVTSMYTSINVIGPRAQDLLSELTDAPLSKQDFLSMTCKEINVGQASGVKAMRLTHSGEDGWCLYIPSEYALHVYDSLIKAGKNYGVRNAGYYALRALRTEKFFAYWGTDLTPTTTPLECGREFRVKLETGNFIGHGALIKQREQGIKKKLVQFLLENHDLEYDPWPWGNEPIYRNGRYVGTTTSTAYGFTLDRHICLGFIQDIDRAGTCSNITNDFILKDAKFEIDIAGKRFPAKANIYPPKLASAEIVINSQKAGSKG